MQILGAIGAFIIVAMLSLGLGLLFAAANVMFRDSENIVDLMLMMATWLSPGPLRVVPGPGHPGGDVLLLLPAQSDDHCGRILPLRILGPDRGRRGAPKAPNAGEPSFASGCRSGC